MRSPSQIVSCWLSRVATIPGFWARIRVNFSARGRGNARREPQQGRAYAEGTAGPETPRRCDWCGDHGRENCDRRDRREIEGALGQGSIREGRSEGARGEVDGRGALGDCQEGRRREVALVAYATKAIANAVLNKALENGEKLKPLKLQKLMYYLCAYYQAAYGEPLIDST